MVRKPVEGQLGSHWMLAPAARTLHTRGPAAHSCSASRLLFPLLGPASPGGLFRHRFGVVLDVLVQWWLLPRGLGGWFWGLQVESIWLCTADARASEYKSSRSGKSPCCAVPLPSCLLEVLTVHSASWVFHRRTRRASVCISHKHIPRALLGAQNDACPLVGWTERLRVSQGPHWTHPRNSQKAGEQKRAVRQALRVAAGGAGEPTGEQEAK